MPYILDGESYTRPEFYRLLLKVNQRIAFHELPLDKQQQLLDGVPLHDLDTLLSRNNMIYVAEDGSTYAVDSK